MSNQNDLIILTAKGGWSLFYQLHCSRPICWCQLMTCVKEAHNEDKQTCLFLSSCIWVVFLARKESYLPLSGKAKIAFPNILLEAQEKHRLPLLSIFSIGSSTECYRTIPLKLNCGMNLVQWIFFLVSKFTSFLNEHWLNKGKKTYSLLNIFEYLVVMGRNQAFTMMNSQIPI